MIIVLTNIYQRWKKKIYKSLSYSLWVNSNYNIIHMLFVVFVDGGNYCLFLATSIKKPVRRAFEIFQDTRGRWIKEGDLDRSRSQVRIGSKDQRSCITCVRRSHGCDRNGLMELTPPIQAVVMLMPGTEISTHVLQLEDEERSSMN